MNLQLVKPPKKISARKPKKVVDTHTEISIIANQLYEESGRRDGEDLVHWLKAEAIFNSRSSKG